jgi:hypothetical protein
LADTNGQIREIKPTNTTQRVSLTRKFYPNSYILSKLYGLDHCYIQGSNDANFRTSTTLLQINRISTSSPIKKKIKNAKYKFVRLVIPYIDSLNESLAGLQFYDSKHMILKGEAISSTAASKTFNSAVFDGNNLTYVQIINRNRVEFPQFGDGINLIVPDKTLFWIGLKFKSKTNISAVELTPRTDDNDVLKGETYKLFYWNKGWRVAGTKKAKRSRIEFIAPKNALLAIKNVNKGKENRIFLYKGNKQIWY